MPTHAGLTSQTSCLGFSNCLENATHPLSPQGREQSGPCPHLISIYYVQAQVEGDRDNPVRLHPITVFMLKKEAQSTCQTELELKAVILAGVSRSGQPPPTSEAPGPFQILEEKN